VFLNVSHYSLFPLPDPHAAGKSLWEALRGQPHRGTVLLAHEGVNFCMSGTDDTLVPIMTEWLRGLGCKELEFKHSYSETMSFKRTKIKVKKEIITMGLPELDVVKWRGPHMPAEEFRRVLENPGETLILDTRNDFEFEIGTFKGAQPTGMKSFRDFIQVADRLEQEGVKDRPIVMFCTGGVRCEKATALLRSKGFSDVKQLDGGILRYFEKEGREHFTGDCFVFDERRGVSEV
jgi:UPF0176 protein